MAITPQAIKDQEFQSRFRGYDTVEVKAYLELIAEEFFELLEQVRQQEEELTDLTRQRDLAEEVAKRLEDDLEAAHRMVEELRSTVAEKDVKQTELVKELEEMQTALDDFEAERKEYEEEISEAAARATDRDELLSRNRSEMDSLRNKITLIEEQNRETKKEEVDFKRTIVGAQRFADDLMEKTRVEAEALVRQSEEQAQDMLRSSEEKSDRALQAARDEIERLRRDAYEELSRLPEEIERLNHQRKQVHDELRSILTRHLEELEAFSVIDGDVAHYEYDGLFQKINFPETEPEEQVDELDKISMEVPLSEESSDNDEGDLRKGLEEGGVAYLSDD